MLRISSILVALFLVIQLGHAASQPKLNGVVIVNEPFIIEDRGAPKGFKGFCMDLIDKIMQKTNHAYDVHLVGDGKYGREEGGKLTGMLGEVKDKKADFALADITVTDWRKAHVDFTEPFIEDELAVLIRKSDAGDMKNIEDLVRHNEGKKKEVLIGFLVRENSRTDEILRNTKEPMGKKIFDWIEANKETSRVKTYEDGKKEVKNNGKRALLMDKTAAKFIAGKDCDMVVLRDTKNLRPVQYAIALQKDRPAEGGETLLRKFNKAIDELKKDGTIQQLKDKYWENKCK